MASITAQIRILISGNLTSLMENAADPEKMLRLLRSEIEESIITLQGALTRANRQQGRLESEITRLEQSAAEWPNKARTAIENGREDLARRALQAGEAARAEVEQSRAELADLAQESAENEQAIGQLEAKLSEIRQQITRVSADRLSPGRSAAPSRAERSMDRIDELERRLGFAAANNSALLEAAIDAELDRLEQDARIDAELARLKAAASASGSVES